MYRRAQNAKTPMERHLTAYYVWEATLKTLASVAIVEYAELAEQDDEIVERLQQIARPSVGHWWEFLRRLLPELARDDTRFAAANDFIFAPVRDDLPRSAGLDAMLREVMEGSSGSRSTVRVSDLFDRFIRYRNQLMHGAFAQQPAEFHSRMASSVLASVSGILARRWAAR